MASSDDDGGRDGDRVSQLEEELQGLREWLNDPLFLVERLRYVLTHPQT